MTATTFNPPATARSLEAAGIERRQAEAIAEGMRDAAASAERGDLATKADLADFATKADLAALRSEMRWMFSFQAALILAIAAKLFGIV